LWPALTCTSNVARLKIRVTLFHSTEMVPRSSVEYLSSARAMDFTSPVIRSPLRIQTESVFCASALTPKTITSRANQRHTRRIRISYAACRTTHN
jgi:hypothetical protein